MKTVTAAVAIKDQSVFITRRSQDQKLSGYWEFPGGKIELGETLQNCLERELREELSVESTIGKVLCESIYEYEHGKIKLVALETTFFSEQFQLSVHDLYEWASIVNLMEYKFAPADIPIANYIMDKYL